MARLFSVAAPSAAPKRKRSRRVETKNMLVFTTVALHLAFVAYSVAAKPVKACFISNAIARAGRSRHSNELIGTTTQDVFHSPSADGRSLRCRPIISSTLAPHLLHVPPPMRSTTESSSLDRNTLKGGRSRRKNNRKNTSKQSSRQPPAAPDGLHHKTVAEAVMPASAQEKSDESNNDKWFAERGASLSARANNMSVNELQSATNKLLTKRRRVGQMKPSELHEATRLLSLWGKKAVKESGPMAEKLFHRLMDERSAGNVRAMPPTAAMLNTVSHVMFILSTVLCLVLSYSFLCNCS